MKTFGTLSLVAAVALFFGGCKPQEGGESTEYKAQGEPAEATAHGHDHDEDHAHGPHDGHIIELGSSHAELVFDETNRKITVYLLDGKLKNPVAIDQPEVLLNLTVETKPVQLKLAAAPQEGEAAGTSSRFELAGDQIPAAIRGEEDLKGRLGAKINGEELSGDLSHEGHEHEHEGDHKDEKEKK